MENDRGLVKASVSDQQDGAGRSRKRSDAMLRFIRKVKEGRAVREVEGFMWKTFGLQPKTTRRYLDYGVRYGELQWTSGAHSRVKVIEV